MSIAASLARVREAPFVLDAVRASDELTRRARQARSRPEIEWLIGAASDRSDDVTAIAAIHALGHVPDDLADAALSSLLSDPDAFRREHAAWSLSTRLPRLDALGRLVDLVAGGGFAGMIAQRTLETWSADAGDHVAVALEAAVRVTQDPTARTRLLETLGTVASPVATAALRGAAFDPGLDRGARAVAIAALGDRGDVEALRSLPGRADVVEDPVLRDVLELALLDAATPEPDRGAAPTSRHPSSAGLRIVQMYLHADLDAELGRVGTGDTGGLATLLVRLGDAFARHDGVDRVVTVSRADHDRALTDLRDLLEAPGGRDGHRVVGVPLGTAVPDRPAMAEAWPARIAVRRGLRRLLRVLGPVDAFHVRMAEVGSLAAHEVALETGVPIVFTVAPDPHALVHALDTTGALTRAGFGDADARDHHWFRIRLVDRLVEQASRRAVFPRPNLREDLRELVGLDVDDPTRPCVVVPEGIDVDVAERARQEVASGRSIDAVELQDRIATLPEGRHGLPVVMSVGRLQRVKGMATVVEAWASDPEVRGRCNLVVVGGDLDDPSPSEREQLDRIEDVLRRFPDARDGVVLAGHRPNTVVAAWLALTRHGGGPVAPGGAYVCGSLKEEFGLAVLEAMAAGNVVVVPEAGGPASYVRPGHHGVLVDTREPREVAAGIAAALDMARRPGVADDVADVVRTRFTIDAMAAALVEVYADVRRHVAAPAGPS